MLLQTKRKKAKIELEQRCKLPTVLWRPRFFNYSYISESSCNTENREKKYSPVKNRQKMGSSTITNILPRMSRLNGPYGVYGTVYGIATKVVHIAHPKPANLVLKSTNSKSPAYNHFKNFSGEGVFTADGEDWKQKRASVIHCLLGKAAETERIEIEANIAADNFCKEVEFIQKNNSQFHDSFDSKVSRVEVNIVPILQKSTIKIIYRYLTNDDVDNLGQSKCDTSHASERRNILQTYLNAVTHIRMIILAQSRSFWFLLPRFFYKIFSPMYKEEERAMKPIRKFATEACANAKVGSPLSMLKERKSHVRHSFGFGNVWKKWIITSTSQLYYSKNILDEAITLLFAGQDTSAATLSWTLHLLSLYPVKQKKLAQEIQKFMSSSIEGNEGLNTKQFDFFGQSWSKMKITKKMTSQLPYLNAVLKESMRLYPVAPFVVRKLNNDIPLPETNAILPKNSFACIWIYGLHRNPLMWKNADQFCPERWLKTAGNHLNNVSSSNEINSSSNIKFSMEDEVDRGITEGAFMPFATGPRNCLGQSIGQVILRIMLTKIIARYEIVDTKFQTRVVNYESTSTLENTEADLESIAASMRRDMQAGFTVLPVGGVRVLLRNRVQ